MRVLFDDDVWVHYGQIYVISDDLIDMTEAFAGQFNGLCGAGVPGGLFLMTGTHTGTVRFTVEWHPCEPPPEADDWEEVVEVSYTPAVPGVGLVQWAGERSWSLDLGEGERTDGTAYRVRYCASGMDEARDSAASDDEERATDRYLLRVWPVTDDAASPDAVLRQTSSAAAYWHNWARGLPPPPTPEQRAETERIARLQRELRDEEYRRREEARTWGGRPPSPRLRQVVGNVYGIARLDRDLVDDVAEADPATQRRIAHWAARHAYAHAGIADLDWMTPAWNALERGEPLPEPFTDMTAMWQRIIGADVVLHSQVTMQASLHYEPQPADLVPADVDPVAMALPALMAAAERDPLQAALEALWAAATAYGRHAYAFPAEVRRAFPNLSGRAR